MTSYHRTSSYGDSGSDGYGSYGYGYGSYGYGYGSYGYGYSSYGYGVYYTGVPNYIVSHYTSIRYGYGYYEAGTRLVDGTNITYAYYIDQYGYADQTYYGSGFYSDVPLYNVGALYSSEYGKFDPFPSGQYASSYYASSGSDCTQS